MEMKVDEFALRHCHSYFMRSARGLLPEEGVEKRAETGLQPGAVWPLLEIYDF
jgi:hypothetical protein